MKLPTSEEMRALDQCAIDDFNIPGVVLMENAGVGTVNMMEQELGPPAETFTCIFVGPGNNGGDGLVIGRHLRQRGSQPIFFFLVNPDKMKGDAALNLSIVQNLRLPFHLIDTDTRVETVSVLYKQIESRGLPCYAIVDSIFGTGLDRPVSGRFKTIIDLINNRDFAHGVPIVAADCPSGMDSNTGKILGSCVKANFTATYGCAKPGHYIHDSSILTGQLHLIDIGIPQEALERANIATELIDKTTFRRMTRKLTRSISSHKGSHGHLSIFAGSPGKTGAAILTARGALRSGSGLVSLCCPQNINSVLENNLIEAMTEVLPGSENYFSLSSIDHAAENLLGKTAAVIGPGIGTSDDTTDFTLAIYRLAKLPLVVDADAINILANNKESIRETQGLRIFTPHPGELSRLIGWTIQEIQDNRLEATREACKQLNTKETHNIVLLKGAGTIIATPDGQALINTTGNPGMATGGMGDVLSGVIGALLCQGLEPLKATAAAVYLHGIAADSIFRKTGSGYTASEVADAIPPTLHALLEER